MFGSKKSDEAWQWATRSLGCQFERGGFLSSPRIWGTVHGLDVLVETFTKRIVEVHQLPQSLYGQRSVFGVVQLPAEDSDRVKGSVGGNVRFSGKLLKVDGLMRNLYVAEGKVLAIGEGSK